MSAAVSRLPMTGKNLGSLAFIEGKTCPASRASTWSIASPTPSYFATMGIPLRAGRYFDEHDDANPAAVLLINETMARKFWPGESAVGKRVKLSSHSGARAVDHGGRRGGRCAALRPGHRAPRRGLPALRGESAGRADPGDPHEHGRGRAQEHAERPQCAGWTRRFRPTTSS